MRIILLAVALTGCAHLGCPRPEQHTTRDVAMGSYGIGGLVGFAGCVAGFAGVPYMIPVCIGGWAAGIGGIAYLAYDDDEAGKCYRNRPRTR